jgi:tetratricopeptide (TPR) repeat protein
VTLPACALAGLLLAAPPPASAAPAFGLGEHLALAREYMHGNSEHALKALRVWLSAEVDRALAELRRRPEAVSEKPLRPGEIDARDVEAALVLHLHVGLLAIASRSLGTAGFHLQAAEGLHLWLQELAKKRRDERAELVSQEGRPLAVGPSAIHPRVSERDFYLTLTGACLGLWGLDAAERFAEAGLRRLPTDGEMLLLAGAVQEAVATERSVQGPTGDARRALDRAERLLRGALAVDERDLEARLRLGHVLLIQDRLTEAERPLETVASEASESPLRYLAWLFLARLRDARGDLTRAAEAYQQALASAPDGQAAHLGLAWLREREAGPSEAHDLVGTHLRAPSSPAEDKDPWSGYILGPLRLTRPSALVDRLRAKVAAP